ncbi:MAG: HAD-IA family hydrolase [Bacilli bacterium]|nr:HAD-IA family hydrolase [Bacilli bacterium]
MKAYKTLIFDLDDTLIDNDASISFAIMQVFKKMNLEYNDICFLEWKKFDNAYWHVFETGKMNIPTSVKTLEEKKTFLRANRFVVFFQKLGVSYEMALFLNKFYNKMLGENIVEIENARRILKELYALHYEIIIATNGPKDVAEIKLKTLQLKELITTLICSDEVGFNKPSLEFFHFLYKRCIHLDKQKMLITGDSLTTDILGGINFEIDTCWFNPNGLPNPYNYQPTYTISTLLELKRVLN